MMWIFISIIVVAVGGYFAYYFWDKKRKAKKKVATEDERPVVKEAPVSVKAEVKDEPIQREEVAQELEENATTRRDFNTKENKVENPYAKAIKEMSPEMKAVVFADIFNRKQF